MQREASHSRDGGQAMEFPQFGHVRLKRFFPEGMLNLVEPLWASGIPNYSKSSNVLYAADLRRICSNDGGWYLRHCRRLISVAAVGARHRNVLFLRLSSPTHQHRSEEKPRSTMLARR
jgi:hypothetical protein